MRPVNPVGDLVVKVIPVVLVVLSGSSVTPSLAQLPLTVVAVLSSLASIYFLRPASAADRLRGIMGGGWCE